MRAGERHRAHLEAADKIEIVVLQRLTGELGEQRVAFRVEHGRLEVEVEIALAAGPGVTSPRPKERRADDFEQGGRGRLISTRRGPSGAFLEEAEFIRDEAATFQRGPSSAIGHSHGPPVGARRSGVGGNAKPVGEGSTA